MTRVDPNPVCGLRAALPVAICVPPLCPCLYPYLLPERGDYAHSQETQMRTLTRGTGWVARAHLSPPPDLPVELGLGWPRHALLASLPLENTSAFIAFLYFVLF